MTLKRIIIAIAAVLIVMPCFSFAVSGEESETVIYHVDSLNGTRWADLICVYKDVASTGQNEWGENIVVNSEGIVTEKIPGGDALGEDLAVPEGGCVVSGTGDIGKAMYASVDIGDKCLFDEYAMRVYFSKGEINAFYTKTLRVTGYNDVRWADTVIIYDKSGEKTGTNPYGYEACVDADGYIVSCGGNDNVIPEGGYVISATEQDDIALLKLYFTVGAKCTLEKTSVTAVYGEDELAKTVEKELEALKWAFEAAKSEYRLIDYSAAQSAIDAVSVGDISTLNERNEAIEKIRDAKNLLIEEGSVETRSVWYTPTENSAKEVKATVAAMKAAGVNELVLAANTSSGTIIPIDTDVIPFKRAAVARRVDLLQTYIDECRANGISIVLLVPVMGNSFAERHTEWYDVTNTGEKREEIFYSPANAEYRKAFTDFIRYILTNYDIDGLQLDYIRYPQFHNDVDAGYDKATIELFEKETGLGESVVQAIGKQLTKHPKWGVWHSFKVGLINSWVEEIYGIASELRPDIYVTAAVAANNGVSTYCQDPATWIKDGYIDGIYVMSYSEGINSITVDRFGSMMNENSFFVMGCGAYLSITNESLIDQTSASRDLGSDGVAYFEWGAVEAHGYPKVFNDVLFRKDAIPFTANTDEVVDRLIETAKARISLYCEGKDEATVKKLNETVSKLPDNGADKASITEAVTAIGSAVGGDAGYLVYEFNAAIRAINLKKADFEFKKPTEESNPSDTSDGEPDESSQAVTESNASGDDDEAEDTGDWWIYVVIGVAVVAVAIVIVKKKK